MIHRKLLFALAACLPLALAGCGGGGGGASSSAPVRSLAPAMTGGVFPASETPSPVTLDGKNEPLAAAARAHNAALAEASRTVNAVLLASASGGTETAREALERFVGTARELADAARNSGSETDREEAQRALNAANLWIGAAQGRLRVADAVAAYSVAANSAQQLYNNAAGVAAFEELNQYISRTLAPLLQAFQQAAQNSGNAADQAEARKTVDNFRAFQADVSERLADLQAGGNDGGQRASPTGGEQPEPNDGEQPVARSAPTFNTSQSSRKYSFWMAEPSSSALRDPRRPSAFPRFEISNEATSIHWNQLDTLFDIYVLSPNRNSLLSRSGYRAWTVFNGVEGFIRTRAPESFQDFGEQGGFYTRSGSRIWARSPRGWHTGRSSEFLRDAITRGEYSGLFTDAHLACRENARFSSSSGWYWTGTYCEGNAQAAAFGDRTGGPPSANGVWRGLITGNELASGSALSGTVTLRYSLANNVVDVAIDNIRSRGDGRGSSSSISLRYDGPTKFTWNSLSVDGNGQFQHSGTGESLGGWFFGPEAEETAGAFSKRFANACPNCNRDGQVVGGWVAKSSDSPASDSTFSGGYSGPATGGDYGQASGGGGGGGGSCWDVVYRSNAQLQDFSGTPVCP